MIRKDFRFVPRNHKSISIYRDISNEQWKDPNWQLQNSIRCVNRLKEVINLRDHQLDSISRILDKQRDSGRDAMRITPYYLSLMAEDPFQPEYSDGSSLDAKLDPIFWLSVPTPANLMFDKSGIEAAMAEGSRSYGAAYQRYPNRVALFVGENTGCASYCQHCQRGKSLDKSHQILEKDIEKGLFYIDWNENIDEVLVTGGDALMIGKERLRYVLGELSRIDHIRSIRIATRVPVVLPMGVTEELLDTIDDAAQKHTGDLKKNVYFMTHINHQHEITQDFIGAIRRIKDHGYSVRNQTVLLRHINDDYESLTDLFRSAAWAGVEPYYLFQCHNERGLTHFINPIYITQMMVFNMQGWVSGSVRPTFAVNAAGGGGKVLLMPSGYSIDGTVPTDSFRYNPDSNLYSWDGKHFGSYSELGRTSEEEYMEAQARMDLFIERPGVFRPAVNIYSSDGRYIRTTNLQEPQLSNKLKSELLGYELNHEQKSPITNPALVADKIDAARAQNRLSG